MPSTFAPHSPAPPDCLERNGLTPLTKSETSGSLAVITDGWTVLWNNQRLDLTSKTNLKHTRLCGDPHIMTDGVPQMDFPSPTCSFILTDGTLIVADAPASNQPLHDVHVFSDDGQHFPLREATTFDEMFATLFVQQDDGSFFAAISREVGSANPNPVLQFRTVT
jgi:hypothetical protein